jgi:hypothetical protein
MRSDQWFGLNPWATRKVRRTVKVREVGVRVFRRGRVERFDRKVSVPVAKMEQIGTVAGAWTDVVGHLYRYTLPHGEVYEEFIQAEPWSSGPCYFIALKDREGNVVPHSMWADEEIDNA